MSLTWTPLDVRLDALTPAERRAWFVNIAVALGELGAAEKWPGRRHDYQDAVAFGEEGWFREWVAPVAVVNDWNRSSCGLVARRVWAACGVDGHGLRPPYKPGMVLADLETLARKCGAWRRYDVKVGTLPEPGDAVFRGDVPHQHVCTVVQVIPSEKDGTLGLLETVDGGQGGGMGGGTEIAVRRRHLREEGADLWCVATDGSSKWPVKGWVDCTVLPVDRPVVAAGYVHGVSEAV